MSCKIKATDLDHIVKLYQSGMSTADIGEKFGVQDQSIRARLVKAGAKMRTRAESQALHLPQLDSAQLAAAYRQGESVNAIAKHFGVSRRAIDRRLLAQGIELRTQSQSETIKWSRMTAAQRARQGAAAHVAASIAFRGKPPSIASRVGKARAWERLGTDGNVGEARVSSILTGLGIPHIAQGRVGAYNIDLAIVSPPTAIAVEVVCTVPGNRYGPKFRERTVDLLNQGWFILFVYCLTGNRNRFERIAEQLPAWLDRVRRDETVIGHYGVIRCDSKHGPILRPYLDGLPCIPAP